MWYQKRKLLDTEQQTAKYLYSMVSLTYLLHQVSWSGEEAVWLTL